MSTARRRSRKSLVAPAINDNDLLPETANPFARSGIPRVTPRNSTVDEAQVTKETPYTNLRQLANILQKPTTPLRRASSTNPPSTRRSASRTAPPNRTPGPAAVRQTPNRRAVPATPHALRALQQRRTAALTPGRDRRRSGRVQRETPRDLLRNLSRALVPGTTIIDPSPDPTLVNIRRSATLQDDDLEGEPEPKRPRLSLALDDDDDSFDLPPRLSMPLDDEDLTQQSAELPRRAIRDQPGNQLSRASFGSLRTSDRFANLNESSLAEGDDGSFLQAGFGDDEMNDFPEDAELHLQENTLTHDIRRAFLEQGSGRHSDIRPVEILDGADEATFVFNVPEMAEGSSLLPEDDAEDELNMSEGGPELEDRPSALIYEDEDRVQEKVDEDAEEDADEQTKEVDEEDGESVDVVDVASEEEDEGELRFGEETDVLQTSHHPQIMQAEHSVRPRRKELAVSKYGIPVPSLPSSMVKKMATNFARASGNSKANLSKDTVAALVQASDWFFEQLGDDLRSYSAHAGRKTIDESDMLTLMKRQRLVNAKVTPFSLAQRYLPGELVQEIRMPPVPKMRGHRRQRRLETVNEDGEEEL